MNWEPIRTRLSLILKTDVELVQVPRTIWNSTSIVFELDGKVYFVLDSDDQHLIVFAVEEIFLTDSEKGLVELLIQQYKNLYLSDPALEKRSWERIQTWILRHLEEGHLSVKLPESIFPSEKLNQKWVPFYLWCGQAASVDEDYKELKSLLDTFFNVETILIPLHQKQWMILVSFQLLSESNEEIDDRANEIEQEESLESLGYGLYDMLESEWNSDVWLTVGPLMDPRSDMIRTIYDLQQVIRLGRKYRHEDHLYFPWKLRLERLLDQIDDDMKNRFLQQTLNISQEHTIDSETIQTLDQFFEENCNVSETAKKLYIHRNTLLYRLDKFKQETNMDVRSFYDAVLVKIALLLYKVTKL